MSFFSKILGASTSRKAKNEIERFNQQLSQVDEVGLGMAAAQTADVCKRYNETGLGDLRHPQKIQDAPQLLLVITNNAVALQKAGTPALAVGFIIWMHTLRAAQYPPEVLLKDAWQMWEYIKRGFLYAPQAIDNWNTLAHQRMEVDFSYLQVPAGFDLEAVPSEVQKS